MIKKITMLIFLILCAATISLGQMASLENQSASPNSTTSVSLTVNNISNINSMTLKIGFVPEQLDFIGLTNQGLTGMLASVENGNTIKIVWTSVAAANPPSLLCNLLFYYKGGSSTLSFLPGSEFTQGPNPIIVGYSDGGVSPAPCQPGDGIATLSDGTCSSGMPFVIPVTLSDMPLTGSFTLKIAYDENMFDFGAISVGGNLTGATASATNGEVTIVWVTPLVYPNGRDITTTGPTFLNLHFVCNLPGNSAVTFAPGSVFTTGGGAPAVIPVCFINADITQVPTLNTAQIDTLTGVSQGNLISLPLILNIADLVGAFTLNIDFNSPVLAYAGYEVVNPLATNVLGNVTGNRLTLVYENFSAPSALSGTFLNLKFHYNGMGEGFVGFDGTNQFDDFAGQPINVRFTDGYVTPGFNPGNASVEIGSVSASVNDIIDVPVVLDGGSSNPLGAATMFIGYDNTKLSFIGAVDQLSGTTIDQIGNQINIAWANSSGVTFTNSTFLKLKFKFFGGGSIGCGSDIYFTNDLVTNQSCELANGVATTIPANWQNGGINLYPVTPVITGQANPVVGNVLNYSTDAGMLNYTWSVTGGTITSGNGTPSISVTWTTVGQGLVSVYYHNLGGCYLDSEKEITILPAGATTDLVGFVTYDNSINQGMNGVSLELYNSLGNLVGGPLLTTTNGTHGYYQFPGVAQDYYTMEASCTAPWAGAPFVSGLDALLVELHTAGIYPLAGIKLLAANVNGGPTVNATDALLIKKRIIGEISSFPAGDWVFDNGLINAFSSPVTTYNFKALCTGDVNGSYNPVVGVKEATEVSVLESDVQYESLQTAFKYTINAAMPLNLGALTLYLAFDPSKIGIRSVSSTFPGLESSVQDGRIVLVWSDAGGVMVAENDPMVTFELVMKSGFEKPVLPFHLSSGCEFADPLAVVINDSKVKMARLSQQNTELGFSVMPNPVNQIATFGFSLPTDGVVQIGLSDLCGTKISQVVNAEYSEGYHAVTFNVQTTNLPSGIYFANLRFSSDGHLTNKVVKLIVNR
jgi:hypothetical protein